MLQDKIILTPQAADIAGARGMGEGGCDGAHPGRVADGGTNARNHFEHLTGPEPTTKSGQGSCSALTQAVPMKTPKVATQ